MKYCPLCGKNYGDETEFCEVDGAILRISGKKDPYLGHVIRGRYQVLSKLGEGGMGTVYLAEQVSVGRKVAIKFLLGNYASDDAFISRFRREARLAASLNHRNIVILYDFDQANDGTLFIVMEYLSGEKLSDVIRRDGPLEISRAARLGLQIADGLDAAHRAGVIHRDIKPDNIMVAGDASEEIKLMDFGIARLRDPGNASQITRAGLIVGTPAYMAPEQVEGGEVSDKTDIYALGVVLYEMLSGSVPFTAATPGAVLIKHMQEVPVPLRKLRRELPASVERVVMQALQKEPQKRQRNMSEVVEQLRIAEEQLRDKATTKTKQPGWNRIGHPFRKPEEKPPIKFEPPAEPSPSESISARTILDTAGPQWAPTQALLVDDLELPRHRTSYKSAAILALLALTAVLGTVFYLNSGPAIISQSFTRTETSSISPPSPELVSLYVSSNRRNLAPKERITLTATGKFSDGNEQQISSGLKWHSSNSSVITINSEGQAEAQNEGIAELSVEFKEQVSAPVTLVVKAEKPTTPTPTIPTRVPAPTPNLRSLVVVSVKRELQPNERMVLRAKGEYSDGKEIDINDGVLWQSSDERIASIDSKGRVTAHRSGQVKLNASYEGVASPAISLVVKDPNRFEPEVPAESRQKPPQEKPEKPRAPDIRENLRTATVFWEQGKYSEAMIELEHALRLAPESKEARSLRIRVMKAWEAEKELNSKKP